MIPVGALVAQLMASARANGDGGLDHSALLRGVLRLSGRTRTTPTPPFRSRPGLTGGPRMPRMRAVDAAVAIMVKEGVDLVFGIPGAAILPVYDALRQTKIKHVLVRHEEGGAHMAEGYTRAVCGKIGVNIGTSGPAGTDMITGLYSAMADSIPILCITGQAPRAKLHKEDFQAVDIAAIARPVTKWAVTVLEAAQVPWAFRQAFQIMRSGRPGPVLLDLPLDVQRELIEFNPWFDCRSRSTSHELTANRSSMRSTC